MSRNVRLINFHLRLKYMLTQKRKGALVLSLNFELITQYSDSKLTKNESTTQN
jgi:hypothetical protein